MLRTYKGTGLFYVISAGVSYLRADCFSRGFATRPEAQAFKRRIEDAAKAKGVTAWQAHELPEMFPDNGHAHRMLIGGGY